MNLLRISLMSGLVLASPGFCPAEPLPAPLASFLSAHCLDCHDAAMTKGEVNLDFREVNWNDAASVLLLERAHRAVTRGEMPPKKKARPATEETAAFLAWLDDGLMHKVPQHGTTFRRLSRVEYARTVEQVFGTRFELPTSFPEDTRAHGFDSVAEALTLSPALLESYAECASMIADDFFAPPKPTLPPAKKFTARMRDMSSSNNSYGPTTLLVGDVMRLALRKESSFPTKFEAKVSAMYRVRVKARAVKPEPGRAITLAVTGNGREIKKISVPETGEIDETIEVAIFAGRSAEFTYADAPNANINSNFPHPQTEEDILHRFQQQPRLLAAWLSIHEEVTDKDGKLRTRAKGTLFENLETSKVAILKNIDEAVKRTDLDLNTATPDAARHLYKVMVGTDQGAPNINKGFFQRYTEAINRQAFTECAAIDLLAVEIEGPLQAVEDDTDAQRTRMRAQLLNNEIPADAKDVAAMKKAAAIMLTKLFRRPAKDEEAAAYAAIGVEHASAGRSLNEALHLMLRTALISPQFIYREQPHERLDAHDLATRLAYMLTVRPPDKNLLAAAANDSLTKPETLRAEAERLLKTKEAKFALMHFAHQWLGTRMLPKISPDPLLGPFTEKHLAGLSEEIEMTLGEALEKNLPVGELIDPDFTFTNTRVGRDIYALGKDWLTQVASKSDKSSDGSGPTFRIEVPRGGRMGGLLGMAGIMMATANGVDTQPVVRGKWVLENIFGDPPPPPPASVPAITPDTRNAKTIRDLMAAHTADAKCAGCHKKLDPPGFVLENYDAIGKWRDTYPVHLTGPDGKITSKPGPAVNSASVMPDGTALKDVTDLKRYVRQHLDQFAGCLAEKLFTYGTGRTPSYAERQELHTSADRILADHGGFRDLLLAVIASEAFRLR
ncbi:MAG: DUF1588 domain-containing protein [Prosthecobacter sp.]|uniref:DUF1588 domain-containing protein n=1 Tax=Prosthecobacter sp. TaxID=1965333 RepID=UPI0038FE1CA3